MKGEGEGTQNETEVNSIGQWRVMHQGISAESGKTIHPGEACPFCRRAQFGGAVIRRGWFLQKQSRWKTMPHKTPLGKFVAAIFRLGLGDWLQSQTWPLATAP